MTRPTTVEATGSPRAWAMAILAGLLVGPILFSVVALRLADFKPEDRALGQDTNSYEAFFEGERISSRYAKEIPELVETWQRRTTEGREVNLWFGASQLHAVNQLSPDDQLAVYYATQGARERQSNTAYLQFSLPNANLHDLLGAYLNFRQRGLIPDRLILALTYDDLREPGFNQSALRFLEPIPGDWVALGGPGVANLQAEQLREDDTQAPVERNATAGSPQERLETHLVQTLENRWDAYRSRGQVLSFTKLRVFELLASARGGAMQRRVPPVPESQKERNLQALDSLIALTRHDGVQLVIYQAPHPAGEPVFYHQRDRYDAFFDALEARCLAEGLEFVNLESLVPREFWGLRGGDLDPFHFTDAGHRLLGQAIDRAVEALESAPELPIESAELLESDSIPRGDDAVQ